MFALILSSVCVSGGGETFIMEHLILVRLFLSLRTRAVGLAEEKGGFVFPISSIPRYFSSRRQSQRNANQISRSAQC